jgi:hypothetical protein
LGDQAERRAAAFPVGLIQRRRFTGVTRGLDPA